MTKRPALTGRERVLLALAHKATDRVPIAMVCSGINEPARREFADHLRRERGIDLDAFLEETLDIAGVGPQYSGAAMAADTDIWGVRRQAVSYGASSYSEIAHHPLGGIQDAGELERHSWPTTALFDYTVLPGRIKAIQQARERSLMVANGNIFETSWYMRGFEQMFMDMALNPDLARG
jgi:uroporphyrinogen decarboxylase